MATKVTRLDKAQTSSILNNPVLFDGRTFAERKREQERTLASRDAACYRRAVVTAAFLRQRCPKRHPYVVEQCRILDVRNLLGQLDAFPRTAESVQGSYGR